jgi:hypothetical protein
MCSLPSERCCAALLGSPAHSVLNASIGEIRLALTAGINEATNAATANAPTAPNTTTGSYGLIP